MRCSPSRVTTTPETAFEPFACHGRKPARYSMPASSSDAAVGVAPRVGHGQHVDAAVGQVERGLEALVARRQHHRLLPRHQPELVDQPPRPAGQHDAGQVVVAEHQRLLDRAGGDHQLGRAEAMHRAALVDRHQQALVDAAGVGRLQDLDAGRVHPLDQRRQAAVAARPAPGQVAAQRKALLDQRHVPALLGRLGGRLQTGLAAADHQHVDVAVHLVEALGAAMARDRACRGRRRFAGSSRRAARPGAGG